jgi:alginate O-acetyltransferase complex protein AlgJ
MMNRFALTRPITRLIVGASLALLPLISAWNLLMPARQIQIGPTLGGVTNEMPVVFSWTSIRDGSFQKAVASRLTEAFALRRILIRINNEIRMELFGELTAPHVVRGAKGQLIERTYLDDYCTRTEGQGAELAAKNIPKLRDIQNYYVGRGGLFVYVLSPSKAAHLPEYFVDKVPCPSTSAARTKLVGEYVAALKQAGINVLDTATLIHSLKGAYDFDLFPQGGVHWNDVGGARAVSAVVDEINRQAGREIVPSFTFTYTLSSAAGADRELVDLLNVFFPPLAYLTPKVKYTTSPPCADHPARQLEIAMVGSSFSHLPAGILIAHNCLARLNLYYYARLGRFGGVPYHELQRNLGEAEMRPMRDAKIMILEENEAFAARNGYVDILRDIVTKP